MRSSYFDLFVILEALQEDGVGLPPLLGELLPGGEDDSAVLQAVTDGYINQSFTINMNYQGPKISINVQVVGTVGIVSALSTHVEYLS